MKLYAITTKASGTLLRYEGTQADAKAASKELDADWEQVEVPTDKAGLIEHLNSLCTQIDGTPIAQAEDEYETVVERQDPPVETERHPSLLNLDYLDTFFEEAPLPVQLHYAAIAVENARDQIKPLKVSKPEAKEEDDLLS